MKLTDFTPPDEVLQELGRRLARYRKQSGLTQAELAKRAGIGVATLGRIEGGRSAQMESWVKVLKALDRLAGLDRLLPETYASPMAEAKRQARQGNGRLESGPAGFVWGDEAT